ncbi:UbiA family prenyltransferase [Micromonospora mirobrigensis]|uniref:Chlorophyll synthase n=1 Tax=Micromonospora mirobrigensis TaxID=262898 RepID=A0A1C4TY59_9ACTN|nr:UbiA family prenyltransferase [Micromonospora mirobrigensis]SCE64326.1 chlorophyll synthase [Micromonospora mirobrigensis]
MTLHPPATDRSAPTAGGPAGRPGAPPGPAARAGALLRLTRPWFWPLGWAAAWFGSVLATRSWLPSPAAAPRTVAALLVLGPLVWGAVLAVNDLHDLPSDRRNPRKATAPLVTGVLTEADLAAWHRRFAVAAVSVALVAGPAFAAGTAVVLLLGWLYSAPPARLKGRPGVDVAVNAVVVGVLAPVAGWSLHRPVGDYPLVLAVLGLLLAAALYLPTTVLDVAADTGAGVTTAAVRWTPRRCRRLGLGLWVVATVVWLVTCHLDPMVRGESWAVQVALAPVLMVAYAVATRRPTIGRMAAVCLVFAVPGIDFLRACVSG